MPTNLHLFADKTIEEWKSLVVQSLEQSHVEGCHFPNYTHIARLGSADALTGIDEAFRFYELCAPFLAQLLASRSCSYMDFGCGVGRIFRVFSKDYPQGQTIGVDCTSDLIKTCAEDFRDYNFEVIPERPPTSLKSGSIDVITAYSVFSHFSCGQNVRWINEFSRLVKSGGLVFLTTYGEGHLNYLRNADISKLSPGHLRQRQNIEEVWGFSEACNLLTMGEMLFLPGGGHGFKAYDYGHAYLSHGYIERMIARDFRLLSFIDDYDNLDQALIVLCKQ
jgi:SAM-dependent methyltransferase